MNHICKIYNLAWPGSVTTVEIPTSVVTHTLAVAQQAHRAAYTPQIPKADKITLGMKAALRT